MPRVYLGIGSNVDRAANVRAALARLRGLFPDLVRSQVFDTRAIGFVGSDFYNLVVGFDTALSLTELEAALHAIESALGRDRSPTGNGARTIDLDVLLYGDLVERNGSRSLPRHDIDRYAFVIGALAEIAPLQSHPISGKTFQQLWQEFDPLQKAELRVAAGDW